jgi:integrase
VGEGTKTANLTQAVNAAALTDARIRTAVPPPKGKQVKLLDEGGLYVLVLPTGKRVWRLRSQAGGKDKIITLGNYPKMTIAAARKARDAAMVDLARGIVPAGRRQKPAVVPDPAKGQGDTFEAAARRWHASQAPAWKPHHAADVMEGMENDVFPKLGALPVNAIEPPEVLECVKAIEPRSVDLARRARQRISAVFCYAIAEGKAKSDPAAPILNAMGVHIKGHRPAIVRLEPARAMLRAAETTEAHPITKLANRWLAITAVRPFEARFARWEEFEGVDGADPLWRIPAERMKMKREHVVPLTPQAIEILNAAKKISGHLPIVFPSTRNVRVAISENAIGYYLNRAGYAGQHVPHGWRSTFSTLMNERHPADEAVIELMLAHLKKDQVAAAYNRALHLARRRELACEWAALITDGAVPVADLIAGARR